MRAPRGNPFPGLRPFRADEEYLFFGRESQVDSMVNKLASTRFLAVVGTSGCGKSSLVNCGLHPALLRGMMAQAGTAWRVAHFRPGGDPMKALARALAADRVLFRGPQAEGLPLPEIVESTLRMSRQGLADIYQQARTGENVNLLLVVDQFEELFRYRRVAGASEDDTAAFHEEATAFVNLLVGAQEQAAQPIYVVLTMRSDFLGDCSDFPGLAEAINQGQYLVPRMSREERRIAISGPVGVGGAHIDPVLLTRLVNDVGDNPDQLSILQHALNRTWARWEEEDQRERPLALEHYLAVGTMARALDQHAEQIFAKLSRGQRCICKRIFKALTDTASDPRGVRRPTRMRDLCAIADAPEEEVVAIIDHFRDPDSSFLMPPVPEELEGDTVIDISHESLMRVWNRLKRWTGKEAQSAQIYRRLAETTILHREDKAGLWQDPDLQVALDWREDNQPNEAWAQLYHAEFSAAMRFLDRSVAAREQAVREEEEKRQRELRRARKITLTLSLFSIVLLAVAVIAWALWQEAEEATDRAQEAQNAAVAAWENADEARDEADSERRRAEELRTIATHRESAARVRSMLPEEPIKALVLAIHTAAEVRKTSTTLLPQIEATLLRSIESATWSGLFHAHHNGVRDLAVSADGQTIVTTGYEKAPRLWDADGNPGNPIGGHVGPARFVAISGDGETILTLGEQSELITLWDRDGKEVGSIQSIGKSRFSVMAISADGQTIVAGDSTGFVRRWGRDGMTIGEPLQGTYKWGHRNRINCIAVSGDGTVVVAGDSHGPVHIWTGGETSTTRHGESHSGLGVSTVAISPDGKTIVSGGYDGKLRIWSGNGELLQTLTGHDEEGVVAVAIAPNGRTILSGGYAGNVLVRDLNGQLLGPPRWFGGRISSLAITRGGKEFVIGGYEGSVWTAPLLRDSAGQSLQTGMAIPGAEANPGSESGLATDTEGDKTLSPLAISGDGSTIAESAKDGSLSLWDMHGRLSGPLPTKIETDAVCIAMSSDGQMIATGHRDGSVKLWNRGGQSIGEAASDGRRIAMPVAISLHEDLIVVADRSKTLSFLNREGHPIGVVRQAHPRGISAVTVSGNGHVVVSAGADGTVRVWSGEGQPLSDLLEAHQDHKDGDYAVVISPDGQSFASASSRDRTVRLWSKSNPSGKWKPKPLRGHKKGVTSVSFSQDGQFLATASSDSTVRIWDFDGNQMGAAFKGNIQDTIDFGGDAVIAEWIGESHDILIVNRNSRKLWVKHAPVPENWLAVACERVRGHAVLIEPEHPLAREINEEADDEIVTLTADHALEFGKWSAEHKAAFLVKRGRARARGGDVASALQYLSDAQNLKTSTEIPSEAEVKLLAAPFHTDRGIDLAREGDVGPAIEALRLAQQYDPEIDLNPGTNKTLEKDPVEVAQRTAAPTFLGKGRKLAEKGDLEGAVEALKRARLYHPEIDINPNTRGNKDEPEATARYLLAVARIAQATTLAREGQTERAIVLFTEAQGLDPKIRLNPNLRSEDKEDPQVVAHRLAGQEKIKEGKKLAENGDVAASISSYQKALEFDSELDLNPYTRSRESNPETVAENWEAAAMVRKGQSLATEGKVADAAQWFEKARNIKPEIALDRYRPADSDPPSVAASRLAARSLVSRGASLARMKEVEQATELFRQALELDPEIDLDLTTRDPQAVARKQAAASWVSDAYKLAREVKMPEAAIAFEEALRLDPEIDLDRTTKAVDKNVEAQILRLTAEDRVRTGRSLARTADVQGAILLFEEARKLHSKVDLDPSTRGTTESNAREIAIGIAVDGLVRDGAKLAAKGNREEAEQKLAHAIKLAPDADLDPATQSTRENNPAETVKQIADRAEAQRKITAGRKLASKGKIPEALKLYKEAEELDPSVSENKIHASAWNMLAWQGSLRGHAAEVNYAAEYAVKLNPTLPGFRDTRGVIRALLGDKEGAIEDFAAYIADPRKLESGRAQRSAWVEALKRGENPLTPEVLESLK